MSSGQSEDPRPVGRPPKPFDKREAEKLMGIWCTKEEIAGWFGMSVATLERKCWDWAQELGLEKGNFEVLRNLYGANTKASLRRTQIAEALKGNTGLLIWCGKQILGQTEMPLSNESSEFSVAYSLNDLK